MSTSSLNRDAEGAKHQRYLAAQPAMADWIGGARSAVADHRRERTGHGLHTPAVERQRHHDLAGGAEPRPGSVLIVARRHRATSLADDVHRHRATPCTIIAVDDGPPEITTTIPAGLPVQQALDLVSQGIVRDIVVAHGTFTRRELDAFIAPFLALDVAIHKTIGVHGGGLCGSSVFCGLPVTTLQRRPLTDRQRLVKRGSDVVASLGLILVFLPLMLLIAAAVALESRGPVFFRQQRRGYNSRTFHILKFRTMCCTAPDADGLSQATRNDRRVTRVGRFLRRSSLDELPQLFNVLKGDMALVGPRPHAIEHDVHYGRIIPQYAKRHRVQPGITGLAQVRGYRGETDTPDKMAKRVDSDIQYIESWSILGDLRILMKTVAVGFFHENAY